MAYDVGSYTPGDGHVAFTAEGPVAGDYGAAVVHIGNTE
jgi:hypothetical protein